MFKISEFYVVVVLWIKKLCKYGPKAVVGHLDASTDQRILHVRIA